MWGEISHCLHAENSSGCQADPVDTVKNVPSIQDRYIYLVWIGDTILGTRSVTAVVPAVHVPAFLQCLHFELISP